ncbi:MAG: aminopeptidase P N-terminal domain-containing protein [Bryobacteraceae bacterium]
MRRSYLTIATLALVVLTPALAQDIPLFTRDFPPEEFAARRAKVYDAIGPSFAVVQGAPIPEGYTRFRQFNEFYYLCGIEVPNAYLLLDGTTKRATIFLPRRNARREVGEGKTLSYEDAAEVMKLSGIEAVSAVDLMAETLIGFARRDPIPALYTPLQPEEGGAMSRDLALRVPADLSTDPWDGRPTRQQRFIELLRVRLPQFTIKDLSPVIDDLRVIKSTRELDMMRKATKLASLAIQESMRSTQPGMTEHELDGLAKLIFYRNGAQGDAYYSLIASGPNAIFPHYNAGKRKMDSGELLLMDYAPDYGYYMADVTRMWPVNGRWNESQRQLYGFYVSAYETILYSIRPHVPIADLQQQIRGKMEALAAGVKWLKPEYEKAAKTFVATALRPGAFGHYVGLATHDVGRRSDSLKPGMVFTIEPALVVPEEKIYIRLEDMIVVTETGAEVLSDFLPRSMDGIEKLMKEDGLLKHYPKAW